MKSLTEFAKKPELLEIKIDTPEIIEEYGEPVVFYMKDYVDINTYFDFFRAQTDKDSELDTILRKIVLNEKGEPSIKEGHTLPVDLAVAVLTKINDNLGKSKTKSLMKETGNPQS
jgi:hypothetical protein